MCPCARLCRELQLGWQEALRRGLWLPPEGSSGSEEREDRASARAQLWKVWAALEAWWVWLRGGKGEEGLEQRVGESGHTEHGALTHGDKGPLKLLSGQMVGSRLGFGQMSLEAAWEAVYESQGWRQGDQWEG